MISPQGIDRGALARLWEARRLFASVYRAEVYNLQVWLIKTMRADKAWQRQVREDLGGEAALTRWDQRYAKLQAGEAALPHPVVSIKASGKKPKRRARKQKRKRLTDRHNMFCLASVSAETSKVKKKRAYKRPLFTPVRDAYITLNRPKPIPLTPDDLREPVPSRVQERAEACEGLCMSDRPANTPRLTRHAIMENWYKIFDVYGVCNLNIMMLDLAIFGLPIYWEPIPI